MSILIAALLLGDAARTQIDDDDRARSASPAATESKTGGDYKERAAPRPVSAEPDEDDVEEGRTQAGSTITIRARRLDAARTQIDAGLGATVYSLTNDVIEDRPGGETGTVSDILMQTPGVTISGPTLNVRGSPANQVRINDVIVPEAIADPADTLSSRLAETTRLITGTLPAQFGFAPAGVISVATKNGLYQHGGQIELFAGSDGMTEPAFEWSGSLENTSMFGSGSLELDRTSVGDALDNIARERRLGLEGLGFADHLLDEENRVSFIFGGSHEHREFGETSIGRGTETNDDGYGVATYQHSDHDLTVQASLFGGVANDGARFIGNTHDRRNSWGTQIDASHPLGKSNLLRFGLFATRSTARELDLSGDRTAASRTSIATYVGDEWKPSTSVTFNPGLRFEWLQGLSSAPKIEPRASLVWSSPGGFAAHAGYARYASARPLDDLETAARLPDERDDYFDAGVQQKLGAFTLGLDAYRRLAQNYIAEHQTPGSAVSRAFSFDRARFEGLELSGTYALHGTSAWVNVSFSRAKSKTIIGGEDLFTPATIAAVSGRYIPLASDRPVTTSAGITRRAGKFSLSGDVQVSSGAVRTLDLVHPNGDRRSPYALVGFAAVYHARIAGKPADLRLDLTNLTNVHYPTSDAANLEGGWTNWGRSRAVAIGIEQGF